ncbi:TrkA family potassium uptake protein, partial [Paenibacillus sp. OT2-17]|uniref:cation:proton antiporter regulatory subunit n=1 Tax=Paenibacillus sp. OT2-17 TaxID=2691605 RepID=UPI0013561A2D
LAELNARTRFGCSVVALHMANGILIAPTAMDRLKADDIMVIIGSNDNIGRFEDEVVNVNEEG